MNLIQKTMRHISKVVSLEQFKSRQCFKIPSYDDSGNLINEFDNNECNYGMIPLDIISNDGNTRITYRNMMNMYFWMWDYVKLLSKRKCHVCVDDNNIGECEKLMLMYENALEYYKNEVYDKSELSKKYYTDLDEKYNKYKNFIGGFRIEEEEDKKTIYYDFDTWVKEEHNEYKLNNEFYNYDKIKDASLDCYKDSKLKERIEEILEEYPNIEINFYDYLELKEYPNTINIPILFTTNIDDVGEYSIFYNEWEEGKKYNNNDIVFYNDRVYKKIGEGDGFVYSTKYKESYFAKEDDLIEEDKEWFDKSKGHLEPQNFNQWEDITSNYFDNEPTNENIFITKETKDNYDFHINESENKSYANKNGKIIFNPTSNMSEKDKDNFMGYDYELIKNEDLGFFVIDNIIYKPFNSKYITYLGNKIVVNSIKADNIKISYCIIDNIKYYSSFNDNGNEIFSINDVEYFISSNNGVFLMYNNIIYEVNNNYFDVKTDDKLLRYENIDSYVIINGTTFYIKDYKVGNITQKIDNNKLLYYVDTKSLTSLGKKTSNCGNKDFGYDIVNNKIYVFIPYNIYNNNGIISGITDSKLSSLRTLPLASDNVGNQMPCSFRKVEKNGNIVISQPKEDRDYLGFPYDIGNVFDLTKVEYVKNTYWGSIITNIDFYYLDLNKEKKYLTSVKPNDDIINVLTKLLKNDTINNDNTIYKKIYCDITYYIGSIIKHELNNGYKHIENTGIKYVDTTYLTTEIAKFYLNTSKLILVNYYKLNYEDSYVKYNELNNKEVKIEQSYFEYNPKKEESEGEDYYDKNDGMIAAPIFREEYKFGSSSLEKVDSNIYIDRGISSSFEKHYKLMEINSLESLEQYGNGFYNIIKN